MEDVRAIHLIYIKKKFFETHIQQTGTLLGSVGDGNRKDIRDAVEAAWSAFPGWGKRSAHDRSQICFYIAENLAARRAEFASTISSMTGRDMTCSEKEVDLAISRLFTYAAYVVFEDITQFHENIT